MSTTLKIAKYQFFNVVRTRWVFVVFALFFFLTAALFYFGESEAKVLVSLLNVTLIFLPLLSVLFGVFYVYNSTSFIELMLTQPIYRSELYGGMWLGIVTPFVGSFVLGILLPFLVFGSWAGYAGAFGTLFIVGTALILIFLSLGMMFAVFAEERTVGMSLALLLWLVLTVVYDAVVLYLATVFRDYPLEQPLIAAMFLNPVDLGRVALLLQLDVSALMGYTGAVFREFFGTSLGISLALVALLLWISIPVFVGLKRFTHRDF